MFMNHGCTRYVFFFGKYVVKIPYFTIGYYGYRSFLNGLIANMQESIYSETKDPRLCPVVFSFPGGFLNVMKRAEVLEEDLTDEEYEDFLSENTELLIPVEHKASSFGILDGRLVAVDYGS